MDDVRTELVKLAHQTAAVKLRRFTTSAKGTALGEQPVLDIAYVAPIEAAPEKPAGAFRRTLSEEVWQVGALLCPTLIWLSG